MPCPRCQHENPSRTRFCPECGTPLGWIHDESAPPAAYADLQRTLSEALEQRTATNEILRVIGRSPSNVQPVLDAVAESAARLCESLDADIWRRDGNRLLLVAHHGQISADSTLPLVRGTVGGLSVLDGRTVQVADVQAEPDEFPESSERARRNGFRTTLSVPLMREGVAIGAIILRRTQAQLFKEGQVVLLQTFADQAVIAIENVRLFKELQTRNRDLSEALDRQTATADVLRIIAQSPTELQPVLDAIATSAVRLCAASDAVIERLEGDRFYNAAHAGAQMKGLVGLPLPLTRHFPGGRAVLDRKRVIIDDIQLVAESEYPDTLELLKLNTVHSCAEIPLLSEGKPLGNLAVLRAEVRPFTDAEVTLLETFADQAVIAIENVRLFKELEVRNRDLTEALEQQTATAEILRVIGTSPMDTQPVFDGIARSGVTVCGAQSCTLFVVDGDMLRVAATHGVRAERVERFRTQFPVSLSAESAVPRMLHERRTIHLVDIEHNPAATPQDIENARLGGYRTRLMVPMMRGDSALGVIAVTHQAPTPFSDQQAALLKTFADQAVIAIENVRLFTELREKNRALTEAHAQVTEALDQQTATADILRVISSSPTDVQPVFDAIVASARRLCDAVYSGVYRVQGDMLHFVAHNHESPESLRELERSWPIPVQSSTSLICRVIRDRAVVHVIDVESDPTVPEPARARSRVIDQRTLLAVPMLRYGIPIGAIRVSRREPKQFSDTQIALLQTFADQAVIAIENVRLFKELQARTTELTRSVQQLTALGEISRAVSSTLDVETVLDTIVSRASQLAGADGCAIYEYDEATQAFHVRAAHNVDVALVERLQAMPLRKGEGLMGRATETREPIQIADIAAPGVYQSHIRDVLIGAGYRALLSVPLLREEEIIGSLSLNRKAPGEFPTEVIEVLKTFATQSALAIQNARLFKEIADKSRQLEVASQHKSEFLANMSHELRTPLNAIIGFSEVLTQRMFGELNAKQDEYLRDIYGSGRLLLSLINDILDLSKIEAGRMELELTDFDLPTAIDNALTLVRERASNRGIALSHVIDERVTDIRADERKVKQVLLNLLSNAIKFTPEGGRIEVRAAPADGLMEISVSDTGVGIAPEDQEAVFEEFRQVGTPDKKAEGTGLGLALSRKFIELHKGRISVRSQVGLGSTFTFTLPAPLGT